jgi:uncharacterized protein DUF202
LGLLGPSFLYRQLWPVVEDKQGGKLSGEEASQLGAKDLVKGQEEKDQKSTGGDPREHLANERTLLSYVRTGIAFISVGIVVERAGILFSRFGRSTLYPYG